VYKKILLLFILIFIPVVLSFIFLNNFYRNAPNSAPPPFSISQDVISPYCDGKNLDSYNLEPVDIKKFEVLINDSNAWYKNLYKSVNNTELNESFIDPKSKKQFPANIRIETDTYSCTYKARVRISGDFKDHVDLNLLKSSLDVKLLSSNIAGITEFKLFIPETKNGSNEIFLGLLLKELGFITPRIFNVEVNVNNQPKEVYIFHEKIRKELVEHNSFPEGPILDIYEDILFSNRTIGSSFSPDQELSIQYANLINTEWGSRSYSNLYNSLYALGELNNLYKNNLSWFGLDFESLTINNSQLLDFDTILIAANANHGLILHNRKFYFNIYDKKLYPIYYDGLPDFLLPFEQNYIFNELELEKKMYYPFIDQIAENAKLLIDKEAIDPKSFHSSLINRNVNLSLEEVEIMLENFYRNLQAISQLTPQNNIFPDKDSNNFYDLEFDLIFVDSNLDTIYACSYLKTEDCTLVKTDMEEDISKFKSLLDLESESLQRKHIIYGYKDLKNNKTKITSVDEDIYIESDIVSEININSLKKEIELISTNTSNYILFGDGVLKDWHINIYGVEQNSEHNSSLFTGCFTIYDLTVENISIKATNSSCEDSVNIVRSQGLISSIEIMNSESDGLDIDFSNIEIENLNVSNALNDCIDLSSGNYVINNITAKNCGDKGLSIGERSTFNIYRALIDNAEIGIAVKDSSRGEISYLRTENSDLCLALYRKKNEFGPPSLEIGQLGCGKEEVYLQKGSNFEN
jgi:hypothetical protein